MKTINRKSLILATVCALALLFGTAAYAEKGAERLVNVGKNATPAAAQVTVDAHKCAACTDILVGVVDKGTKGPNFAASKVARHNCSACETKIITAGNGKMTHEVALHSCNAEVKPACCVKN